MNRLQLRVLEKLPAAFYLNTSTETTFRLESNIYQYPLKRTLLHKLVPPGTDLAKFSKSELQATQEDLRSVAAMDNIYRVNPNITMGWSPTNFTQYYVTYFLLRDSLLQHSSQNSTTQAVGLGAQHTFLLSDKVMLQPQFTIRELWQTGEPNVLDYLPAVTLQYQPTGNLALYLNSLFQMRQKFFFSGPGREMNPFHTAGLQYQRGRWAFLASVTFLQNFRQPFGKNAIIQQNNDAFVCDYEVDRQLFAKIPGLQAILRAEPVYNFNSNATPGLAGMDFRLYYGLRFSAAKPAFADTMKQLQQRYKSVGCAPSNPAGDIAFAESH